jgi:tRNA(Ile)-lysidine synthetase-like protein
MCLIKNNNHILIHKVREFLTQWCIPQYSKIIIAFSGGPDSTALLYSLSYLKKEWRFSLYCAYLNHGLRNTRELQKEINHIKKTCKQLQIKVFIQQLNQGELAEQARNCKRSIEEIAREARYKFLYSLFNQHKCDYIALGHSFDDQIETILMRVFQGSGISGLSGIQQKRQNLLRPLLDCTRQEISDFLSQEKISYTIDSSNKSMRFLRNQVRHKLIPSISEVFPGFKKALFHFQTKINYVYDYIESESQKQLVWSKTPKGLCIPFEVYLNSAPVLRLYSLYFHISELERQKSFLKKKRIPFNFLRALVELESPYKNKIWLRGYGIIVYTKNTKLFLERDVVVPRKKGYFIDVKLDTVYKIEGREAVFRCYFTEDPSVLSEFTLVKEEITMPLMLRSRKKGDKIDFGWGHKKIKKIFNEYKIPPTERNQIPILEDRKGVIAIIGMPFGLKNFFRKGVAMKENLHDNGLHCIIERVER